MQECTPDSADAIYQLPELVETFIREREGACWLLVLADFREQRAAAADDNDHRACCERWLHLYTRAS